jgi:hypothetical protein
MTPLADLEERVDDLRDWLPEAQARTHIPDTETTTGPRGKPGSRPPWNSAVAMVLLDALQGARQLEAMWRSDLAGHAVPLRPIAATGGTLAAIVRLSQAVSEGEQRRGVILVTRWTSGILRLTCIDREEPPQKVQVPCPYCQFGMVWLYPRAGRVTCLRYGACFDDDGLHPVAFADRNRITWEAELIWHDGHRGLDWAQVAR